MARVLHLLRAGVVGVMLAGVLLARAAEPPGKSLPTSITAPGVWSLSVTGEYTTGDYGTSSSTDIWYFPATLRYETERAAFRLTVPFLRYEGSAGVVVSPGDHSAIEHGATGRTSSQTQSGLGDIIISAGYVVIPEGDRMPAISLTGKVKWGTADSPLLGTGENDYAAELGVLKSHDRFTGFGGAGYKILGNPSGINFKNIFYGFAGVEYRFDELRSGGVVLDVAQAATAASSDARQLTAYLVRRIDKTLTARGYAILGLSDGAPDWGLGAGVIYYWR